MNYPLETAVRGRTNTEIRQSSSVRDCTKLLVHLLNKQREQFYYWYCAENAAFFLSYSDQNISLQLLPLIVKLCSVYFIKSGALGME